MSNTLYVKFEVSVSDSEYYGGNRGKAEVQFSVPEEFVGMLNTGTIFKHMLQSALERYRAEVSEENNNA